MGKSTLYAANQLQQVLAADSVINFGNIVRRYGCNCSMSGGNPIIRGAGYYNCRANFTVEATDAGNVTIELFSNGTAIPGAKTTQTVSASSTYGMSIPGSLIRAYCDVENVITATISGAGATITNAAIIVEKE